MGLISNLKTARLALTRRKIKNLSAILAITLGVTLMVGIQITTATLENSFTTGLLITEGEVDLRISNATGNYLTFVDKDYISSLVPEAAVAVELETNIKGQIGPQYEPRIKLSGIELNYSERFGVFEDWNTGEHLNLESLLTTNKTILLASTLET